VWNEKGNIHFQNKDYREAIVSYKNAIDISPSFGRPYHNLALIHFIQGNFDEAILLYQESIGFLITDHEKAMAWNGLGNAYRCKKDYANALLAFQQASELDKENGGIVDKQIIFEVREEKRTANFWNELGMLFFKTGAYAKAASAFQKSIDLEPSSGHFYSNLARVRTTQGQYKEALYLYRKSIDLLTNEKERANAWNRLGDVHRKLNDYDNALKAYQKATTLKNDKMSLLNRARLSLLSNRKAN
jgi:tetratricopeptide (TPR) repeat protein